ncbi:hypothetical protein IMSAGC018_01004 [Lachnospiraceae bacterium]|nr:hypothetical protein IMSAGC018_01004 [Lachnospiraceae bacterium]
MLDAVNRIDTVQIVVHGIVDWVFSRFQCKTFVSHVLQCNDLAADFLLSQFFAGDVLVFHMVRTVGTAVYAIVRQVQRCKKYDTVAIEVFLDLLCQPEDFLIHFFVFAGKENGSLSVGKSLAQSSFFD